MQDVIEFKTKRPANGIVRVPREVKDHHYANLRGSDLQRKVLLRKARKEGRWPVEIDLNALPDNVTCSGDFMLTVRVEL